MNLKLLSSRQSLGIKKHKNLPYPSSQSSTLPFPTYTFPLNTSPSPLPFSLSKSLSKLKILTFQLFKTYWYSSANSMYLSSRWHPFLYFILHKGLDFKYPQRWSSTEKKIRMSQFPVTYFSTTTVGWPLCPMLGILSCCLLYSRLGMLEMGRVWSLW